jgi:hypothetical protein
MIGRVNDEFVWDVSQAFAPQLEVLLDADEVEVEVSALRASTTRSGIAKFIIDSILSIGSGSAMGMRGPNLAT